MENAGSDRRTHNLDTLLRIIALILVTLSFASSSVAQLRHYIIIEGSDTTDKKYATGAGTVDKHISVEKEGWYELFVDAAPWPTDLFLDGHLIAHLSFSNPAWPDGPKHKALNLYLQQGEHLIRLERRYHPGLPYIRSVQLKPSTKLSGKVNISPNSDRMVLKAGDEFSVHLSAGKQSSSYSITLSISDAFTSTIVHTINQAIPGGTGQFEVDISIPTDEEGVFNVEARNIDYGQVARSFQYVIIDTRTGSATNIQAGKELIKRINPVEFIA